MTAEQFFYLVARMRQAQNDYFRTRNSMIFKAARALENEVDEEIARVKDIIRQRELQRELQEAEQTI